MEKKQLFRKAISFIVLLIALAVAPTVFAAYDCTVRYSDTSTPGVSDALSPFTQADLDSCCFPAGDYKGSDCRAEGKYAKDNPGASPDCLTLAEVNASAKTEAKNLNYNTFNCLSGNGGGTCRPEWCLLNGTCQKGSASVCPAGTHRDALCNGHCGACTGPSSSIGSGNANGGYVYCEANNEVTLPKNLGVTDDVTTCSAIKYGPGSENSEIAATSCYSQGLTLLNKCTGQCGCPSGLTKTGRTGTNTCISYAERLVQIFEDGLTILGGPAHDGKYDYSVTGTIQYMKDVFLKSDSSEALNWNSPTLPPVIKNLIKNNGNNSYLTCDANQACPGGMTCSDAGGGVCYTAGGVVGTACTSASACNWGLMCDASGHCADPNGGLTACTIVGQVGGAPCAGTETCGTDHYCHKSGSSIGDTCASNAECPAGALCNSATLRVCEAVAATGSSTLSFVGITSAKYTAGFTVDPKGYQGANSVCSSDAQSGFANSHVCSSSEILALYNRKDTKILAATVSGIITAGPPGYTANADDCRGFTVKTIAGEKVYFRWWDFSSKYGSMSECANNLLGFACCK